ncbi:MAG: EamA-like transporter family protein [Deltaproteobacteria bacterium]|nr:MAG: EamA-like transporter family protein [Deltaproteobacteria bacterium]
MKTLTLMAIALLVGGVLPLQSAINSRLGQVLSHPLQASFISFLGGTIGLLAVLTLIRPELPSPALLRSQPLHLYIGGLLGAAYVTMVITIAPRIGIANTLTASIAGSILVSVIFDHFGLMGMPVKELNLPRIVGSAGMLVSLLLIQRG